MTTLPAQRRWPPNQRRGSVLIVAIVLVFTLASVTLALCRSMRVEIIASANHAAILQASAIERGAEQYLLAVLTEESSDLSGLTEDYFAAVPVGEGYFWILRPDYGDSFMPVFGMIDESAKLNINTATYDQLMMLPCMTDDVATAIVDWRDEDSDLTQGGAENEYYLSLADPYYCKNASFESVEELLLVRGTLWELLYGEGQPLPMGSASLFSMSGSSMLDDVWLRRGIYDLLTIYSNEPSTSSSGGQKISLTDPNQRSQLRDLLRTQLGSSRGDQAANALGSGPLRDIFDLYFQAQLTADELALITDGVTSGGSARGRINVNTAPREVLLTLDGLDTADVDKLVSQRRSLTTTQSTSIAWVADALGQKAVGLGNRITGRGYQYSAYVLAASGNGRAFKQVRVVIDASGTTPQIVYRRDITDRGWLMEPEILASLRAGEGLSIWSGVSGSALGGSL
ncbi:MAG TPA: type II secretion system protein GspK [Phycisphaerae bacterium]|nr:type II secretion system protein GspK [Phycisphaerae bacterium]HRY68903.1 type II secretion system protein GspK [Phycisphaerae bacterium]HSA25730.1 type II secretion system protein GspK [Phycisphaerae bacterium]